MNNFSFSLSAIRHCVISIFLCIGMIGCESITPELFEYDDDGEIQDNSKINIQSALVDIGIKGYAIDSIYTEFGFYQGKNVRIESLRKGVATYMNNRVETVKWDSSQPRLEYPGSTIIYTYNGIQSVIMLNAHGFAEHIINKYGDGSLQSKVDYTYDMAGYLNLVRLERPGMDYIYISYQYPDEDGGVTIKEGGDVHKIPLYMQKVDGVAKKLDNVGYICNVLRYGNAPLTNTYVINPDLYYEGIYGTPIKYLPTDELIEERSINSEQSITRVGNWQFFYK
ncbi:MAG: ferredoxin [Tannerella sp.]|jgi:hypothetical protein|nr:ferredoxin [Tannerella sp.]